MAFVGIQFDESVDGSLALVHTRWLTPRKKEVFWPPFKHQEQYDKALKKGESPVEGLWSLYPIQRCFFECDELHKAKKKLKQAELTSDIQSEGEENISSKRKRFTSRRLCESSESDNSDAEGYDNCNKSQKTELPRPPRTTLNLPQTPTKTLIVSNTPSFSCTPSFSGNSTPSFSGNSTPSVSSRDDPADTEFRKNVIYNINYLKQQNEKILNLLEGLQTPNLLNTTSINLPQDIPVNFPLNSEDDVTVIEDYLLNQQKLNAVCCYFSTLGGRDITTKTNFILKNLLTNNLACTYSFLGSRNNKKSFADLKIKTVVVRSVQIATPTSTEKEISDSIKVWLKHAPQRVRKENQKQQL